MSKPAVVQPFDDIREALATRSRDDNSASQSTVRSDLGRLRRTGTPEIVYGAGKTPHQTVAALTELVEKAGRAIATRCDAATLSAIEGLRGDGWLVEVDHSSGLGVIADRTSSVPVPSGLVGIIAAGTSDLPVAREIEFVTREIGCGSRLVVDVGVAGLHRLVEPLEDLVRDCVDILVVVAGMDGALPSVVAGLVRVPVIGVPTSTGYGFGGDGTGALMAMIQSCAPGLTVVNIDNGVGAAIAASRIVHSAHRHRSQTTAR